MYTLSFSNSKSLNLIDDKARKTHVIFELDGVVLDTGLIYYEALKQMMQEYNVDLTTEVYYGFAGILESELPDMFISQLNLPIHRETFLDDLYKGIEEKLVNAPLKPGVEKLVRHLHEHNIPVAIASETTEQGYKLKSQNHQEFFSLFHHIVCGSSDPDIVLGKPAPDLYLTCATRFEESPRFSDCLVFEYFPNGVVSASDIGMTVILVPESNLPQDLKMKANTKLDSLEEFQPELYGLPPFDFD